MHIVPPQDSDRLGRLTVLHYVMCGVAGAESRKCVCVCVCVFTQVAGRTATRPSCRTGLPARLYTCTNTHPRSSDTYVTWTA